MKKLIFFSFLCVIQSCNDKNLDQDKQVKSEEISISIPDNFSNSYSISSDNLNDRFIGYFLKNNSFDFIDLKGKVVIGQKKVTSSLSETLTQGGGVTYTEEGVYYKTNTHIFFIPTELNQPSSSFPLNSEIANNSEVYFNSAMGIQVVLNDIPSIPIYQGSLVLPLHSTAKPYHFTGIYLLSKDFELQKLIPLQIESEIQEDIILFDGLNLPFLSNDNKYIYAQFPFTSDVIKIDSESGTYEVLDVPGKFIQGSIDKSRFLQGKFNARTIRYSAQFWDIVWDSYREVFYRIEKEEHFDENGEQINPRRGDHWINIISEDWKVLGHFKLPDDHLARPYVTEDGIYFQRSNSDNESELRFAFYEELPVN